MNKIIQCSIRHKLIKCANKVLGLVKRFERYKQKCALGPLFGPPRTWAVLDLSLPAVKHLQKDKEVYSLEM